MKTAKVTLKDVESVNWDWKEDPGRVFDETVGAVNEILKRKACSQIFIYDDPAAAQSDSYGYILSPQKLTKKQVKQLSDEGWGNE